MIECRLVASHGLWYKLSGGRASDFADFINSRFKLISRLMNQFDGRMENNIREPMLRTKQEKTWNQRWFPRVLLCRDLSMHKTYMSTKPQPR